MGRPKREEPYYLKQRAGVWNIFYYSEATGRTERHGLRTRDYEEALARLVAWKEDPETQVLIAGNGGEITIAKALDDYTSEHVEEKVADPVRQENAIVYLKSFLGQMLVSSIDIPLCRAYKDARLAGVVKAKSKRPRKDQSATPSTVRRELTVLRAAANHALRWKRIEKLPPFELPPEAPIEQEAGFLSKYDIATLIFEAEGELRDFILFAYYWGARRASVERLETKQVFLDAKRVNLMKPGARITKKRKPSVPVFPQIAPRLKIRCENAKNGFLFGPTVNFYRPFNKLCERLGLAYSHPHVLRHSRASHMLMDGVDPYKVARLIGDTLKTVERVYGGHSLEFLMEDAA